MALSDELRESVSSIWEQVVTHPFVLELGDGTLSQDAFTTYFDQDYLFLKDWKILLSLATAKSADFDAARQLVEFLHLGLGGEEGLFQQAFRERGLSRQDVTNLDYLPTTLHYSGYLRRRAYEGSFIEVIATLLAVEWPYLDWAQRLDAAGKHPDNRYYQTWIDIHTSDGMSGFVNWMRQTVDAAQVSAAERAELQTIFRDVLRYELLFFEMAYRGEAWPQ
ncbi:MAG: thiaminase II [Chloroflexi bacterium]|nr:thiaminase II [Chloroflexota bacterium]MDA1218031.1 thiaminase II [Chloroflexota bacterium]PKB57304.1 MAG: thiaminase II [SAR202 cluster bacterium Casp-Chloro-G3]